jgi:predicted transcriptional regulator
MTDPQSLTQTKLSSLESRALKLLGQGLQPSVVSNALGVTQSAISQLLSNPEFSERVKELRVATLTRQSSIDENYDKMEHALQKKLYEQIPLLFKPREILHAIQIVNAAKRRGAQSTDAPIDASKVVQLIMPTAIQQTFVTNINQQVIQAGQQDLTTLPSGSLQTLISEHIHEQPPIPLPAPSNA